MIDFIIAFCYYSCCLLVNLIYISIFYVFSYCVDQNFKKWIMQISISSVVLSIQGGLCILKMIQKTNLCLNFIINVAFELNCFQLQCASYQVYLWQKHCRKFIQWSILAFSAFRWGPQSQVRALVIGHREITKTRTLQTSMSRSPRSARSAV